MCEDTHIKLLDDELALVTAYSDNQWIMVEADEASPAVNG